MTEPEGGFIELRVVESLPPPPTSPPPAPHRATGELRTLAGRAGWALLQAGLDRQANIDLVLAARRLGAAEVGWTIVERLGAGQPDAQLEALFGQDWDVLEETAMSLGFGQTVSALDLCADAVLLACGEQSLEQGRLYGLRQVRERDSGGQLVAPLPLRAWVDQLLAHPDLALLKECRDHLTHRTPRRETTLLLDQRGRTDFRRLAELTTLHGQAGVRNLGSIGQLVPRLVGFGEEQLEALCRAILDTWGG